MSKSTQELFKYFSENHPEPRPSVHLEELKEPVERDKDGNLKVHYTMFETDKETSKSIAHERFYFAKNE